MFLVIFGCSTLLNTFLENEREIFKVGFRNSRVCFDTTILCNNGLFAE